MASKVSAKSSSSTSKIKGKQAARPKQPLSLPEILKRLFTSLCAQIDGGHFNNAIKTCDKILRVEPNDADAAQTKLFLLLQTEQYDAALSMVEASGKASERAFERAYSLYRLKNEQEARKLVDSIKEDRGSDIDRGVLILEAQLSYREGDYERAVDLYNELLETIDPQSEEYSDLSTNLRAAHQHLDFINTGYLKALDALPTSLTTSLESNPPPPQQAYHATAVLQQSTQSTVAPAPPPEKQVRKSHVPAGVIPGVTPPPDPERWLKKTERSTYGQGRRRKGPGGSGATQGSASVETAAPVSTGHTSSQNKPSGGKGKKRK
ncbi:hypothetical protein Hypma_012197 [Hypsizygus marmoreus]|uniref:Signal recognition particle subunit SRP72 n=1 Tax=Hypsizygus marmoreus TaxID=39966 RepID=A0A369JEL9_HYPMA|nr:hypothetical protein Hypma_012197 [Hypsizygus marmoreus]